MTKQGEWGKDFCYCDPAVLIQAEKDAAAITAALKYHWVTKQMWGGELREACGLCAYMDGVRYQWPCPTVQALTGAEAPHVGPAAALVGDPE